MNDSAGGILATDLTFHKTRSNSETQPNTPSVIVSSAPTWSGKRFYRPAQAQQQPGVCPEKTPLKVTGGREREPSNCAGGCHIPGENFGHTEKKKKLYASKHFF